MREGTRASLPSPPLLFIAFFTSHRSPLSERLEQATSPIFIHLFIYFISLWLRPVGQNLFRTSHDLIGSCWPAGSSVVSELGFIVSFVRVRAIYCFLNQSCEPFIQLPAHPLRPWENRPLSGGGHFVSGVLKGFFYARPASFSLRGYPCIDKPF